MKNVLFATALSLLAFTQTQAQVRPVAEFHAVRVGSGIELTLTAGHAQRVDVQVTPAEFGQYLTTNVENGTLTLRYDNRNDPNGRERNRQHAKLRVAVTADQLTALTAGSGSSVKASGDFTAAEAFKLDVSSGASLAADIKTASLNVDQSSGSTVSLNGQATKLSLETGSGATFNGDDLQTSTARVQASSGSSVNVAVKDDLVAEASSGASIHYRGQPQLTKHVSSGASVSGR